MRKNSIYFFIAGCVVFALSSCHTMNDKKEARRIFPEYHYALDSILRTGQGTISGVELGQSMKLIPVEQVKQAIDKDRDHITYEQDIDSLTKYIITYSLENDTISEIEVRINSQSQDEGDRILNDLKNYYRTKYTAPIMDKGYFVFNCFDSKRQNFKITLTDNGGAISMIEMLVYREK